jgi:hypothetical protein
MSRLFGIAGVQMAVVPWDAQATIGHLVANRQQGKQSSVIICSRTLCLFSVPTFPGIDQSNSRQSPNKKSLLSAQR